jgi:hypothetical protein
MANHYSLSCVFKVLDANFLTPSRLVFLLALRGVGSGTSRLIFRPRALRGVGSGTSAFLDVQGIALWVPVCGKKGSPSFWNIFILKNNF